MTRTPHVRRCSWLADRLRSLGLVAGVVAILAAAPAAFAHGTDAPAGKNCVGAEEARVHVAGDSGGEDEGAPPKFTAAFYRRVVTLDVSLDGLDGRELPISIEEVCEVPKSLKKQAAQLAGADGVALLLPRTTVWEGGEQLVGKAAETAVAGADTAVLRVRLARPRVWKEDEDGDKVATFRTGRAEVTD
jgi:hypothetical protein